MNYPVINVNKKFEVLGSPATFHNGKLTIKTMKVTVKELASNFRLNRKRLIEFAMTNTSKYGIVVREDGAITTSTMFSDTLVKDFKAADVNRYLEVGDLLGYNVLGWTCECDDMSGGVYWSNENTNTTIWATPCWENEKGDTPFSVYEDDPKEVLTLHLDIKESIDKQRDLYISVLKTVIQSL